MESPGIGASAHARGEGPDVRGSILIVGGAFAWEGDLGLFKVEKAGRALAGVCPSLSVCSDAL